MRYLFCFYKTYIRCLDCKKHLKLVELTNGSFAVLYCPNCIGFFHCETYIIMGNDKKKEYIAKLGSWRYNPKSVMKTKFPNPKIRLAIYNRYKEINEL